MPPLVVGVRFSQIGKVYHFDASSIPNIQPGDRVIVETTRGRQLGEVTQKIKKPSQAPEGAWKQIERLATPRDLVLRQTWQRKELEAVVNCRQRSTELKLTGVKIVAAEFSFDGARLALVFSSENEEKVDLKSLRSEMCKLYPGTQVDMRQIGPRDVAKQLRGLGACGLETRCCSKFLTDFSPISIKMAKEQGISLTPEEITGMCGRLRCCLVYEYEQYATARKGLPKRNKRVVTPLGEGRVVDILPLQQMVIVELPEVGLREYERDQIEPWDEEEAMRRKSAIACADCRIGETNPATT